MKITVELIVREYIEDEDTDAFFQNEIVKKEHDKKFSFDMFQMAGNNLYYNTKVNHILRITLPEGNSVRLIGKEAIRSYYGRLLEQITNDEGVTDDKEQEKESA